MPESNEPSSLLNTPTEVARFWSKVRMPAYPRRGCWLWTGATDSGGYGSVRVGGSLASAHRVAWAFFHGSPQAHVLHKCDTPACVNPKHLFDGTHRENMADMAAKGRGRNAGPPENPRRLVGVENPAALLTDDDVREIRRLYASSGAAAGRRVPKEWSQARLAARFGVTQSDISSIVNNKTWRHIT